MRVRSNLIEASFEVVDNSEQSGLDKTSGRFYFNEDTGRILVGNKAGDALIEFKGFQQISTIGDIKASALTEADFQTENPDGLWLLCDGQNCENTDYADYIYATSGDIGINDTYNIAGGGTNTYFLVSENKGAAQIDLTFDGIENIGDKITDWNTNNPANRIDVAASSFTSGDVPENATLISLYTRVPNTGGLYLRGKNNGRSTSYGNPDGEKALTEFQADKLKAHNHNFTIAGFQPSFTGQTTGNATSPPSSSVGTTMTGENETAPRTMTVNYFIKVDRDS